MPRSHPLLRKVNTVGNRDMDDIPCVCDRYPFPHRNGSCDTTPRYKYGYEIYSIVPSNNPALKFDGEFASRAASLERAFHWIDTAIEENPENMYGIVCRDRWIFVPKNL